MMNEVSNVGGVQHPVEVRKQAQVTVQESVKVQISFSKGSKENKPVDFNLYGKDLENFDKFKGNDKHDAMRMTNTAANDVKKAYMQLQHEFPDVSIAFEPMPDPKKCGKKREGFFTYQQQLEDWKDIALTQIANARETSTAEKLESAAGAIIANDDANAVMNAEITSAAAGAIIANDNRNAEDINRNIDGEGAATRETVRKEAAETRNTVMDEHTRTRNLIRREAVENRNAIHEEGAETRNDVAEKARHTQEIQVLSDKISDVLNNRSRIHTPETTQKIGELRDRIVASDASHEVKVALLNDLADFVDQSIISNREINQKRRQIDFTLRYSRREIPENPAPEYPEVEPAGYREVYGEGGNIQPKAEVSAEPAEKTNIPSKSYEADEENLKRKKKEE